MQKTLKPHTIFCHDNLPVLRGINSNSIDLIYLDPPFNKGRQFHAPVGSEAEGADFNDIWHEESVKDEWHDEIRAKQPKLYKYLDAVGEVGSRSAKYYLIYMAVRLFEMHRVLKDTGSLYLHCDTTASHYLRLLLDTIFGYSSFVNEVIWHYQTGGAGKRWFARKHDVLLFYTKTDKYIFTPHNILVSRTEEVLRRIKTGIKNATRATNEKKLPMDVWTDIQSLNAQARERTGYPTQKPLALLERIIKASCLEKGLVLDPFCGCATTCIAASRLERQWIGIDVSPVAFDLVQRRLQKEVSSDLFRPKPIYRTDIPTRTDRDFKKDPTKEDKYYLYGKQDGKCNGCKRDVFKRDDLDIDHIVPKADGGGNERENLQLLCPQCNRIKGKRPMAYLMARLKE